MQILHIVRFVIDNLNVDIYGHKRIYLNNILINVILTCVVTIVICVETAYICVATLDLISSYQQIAGE